MKKKVLVDLPDNLIDEETKKIIKTQKNKIASLETKIRKLQSELNEIEYIKLRATKIIEAVKEAGDFTEGWGD